MYERKGINETKNSCTWLECFALSHGEERHICNAEMPWQGVGGHGFVYNE